MNHRRAWLLLVVMMLGIGLLMMAPEAYADRWAEEGIKPDNCGNYVGLTNKIAGCIRKTVDGAAQVYFTGFYPLVQKIIAGACTLAVVLYGVLLAYGMVEKLGRDTMILLFKVTAVISLSSNSPLIYDMTTKMMDGAALAAISYTPPSESKATEGEDTTFSQAKCMQLMTTQQEKSNETAGTSGQKKIVGPWLAMDCLLDTVVGIKVNSTSASGNPNPLVYYNEVIGTAPSTDGTAATSNPGMSRALLYLFFSGMQTSTVGLVLAIIGFIYVWGLVILVIKALYTYLAGYIGITLLVIVSPLFIPLILFRETKNYFDKWFKSVISMGLQPVVMMAFITFSLAAIDFATFSGKYSIWYRIAGEATTKDKFDLNKYLTDPRKDDGTVDTASPTDPKSKPIIAKDQKSFAQIKADNPTPNQTSSTDQGGLAAGQKYTNCTKTLIKLSKAQNNTDALEKACSFKYDVGIWTSTINWDMMAKARTASGTKVEKEKDSSLTDGQQIAREVISAAVFCAMVIFIMNGLLTVIPFIAQDLLGDALQSSNIAQSVGNFSAGGSTASGFASRVKAAVGGK